MKKMSKHLAALLAGVVLTGSFSAQRLDFTRYVSADTESLSAFLSRLTSMHSDPAVDSEPFCTLQFSEKEQMLYRDGTPVGTSFGPYRIQNRKLYTVLNDTDRTAVPIEEAAARTGCTVSRNGSDLTVQSPFQNARLIVKSETKPQSCGAVQTVSGYRGLYVMQYDTPEQAYQAYQHYKEDPSVVYVDPDTTFRVTGKPSVSKAAAIDEDNLSWGVADIGADRFCQWLKTEKSEFPTVRVAVIDTGVYQEHTWLEGRITDDGAGFIMNSDGSYHDVHGHGTHCSGIIASCTPENVKIIPLKALNDEGYGESIEIYCAMMYALERNADVVSMSLGGLGESPLLEDACAALEEADIPLCVSAGNETQDAVYNHPASFPSCFTIGAIDSDHELALFSNYGSVIDFVAPGVSINSSVTGSPTATAMWDGTSMAAPFVSAAVADLLSYQPSLSNDDLYQFLRANALDLGDPGFDDTYGWGEISLEDFRFSSVYCPAPSASPKGDYFPEAVDVSLYCAEYHAAMYYTLDGSMPDPKTATLYSGPIHIDKTTMLRAVAFIDGETSREMTEVYCLNGQDLADPYEIENGVLKAYHGVLSEINLFDLTQKTPITEIGEGAFEGNTRIQYITLPKSVEKIGDRAFHGCSELIELSAPGVRTVGESAFCDCKELRTLDFNNLSEIGKASFKNCYALCTDKYIVSKYVTEIPDYAFYGCFSISEIELGPVVSFGDCSFTDCTEIKSFGKLFEWRAVKSIGELAFSNTGLTGSISLDQVETLGKSAFCLSMIQELILPETVTEIPEGFAEDCGSLRSVTAPGVTKLGDRAFAHAYLCDLMLHFDVSKIIEIGEMALMFNRFSEPLSFDCVTTLGYQAFAHTEGVTMSFPAVLNIPKRAFWECDVNVLYLQNAETVETEAISGNCVAVFGERVQNIADRGIQTKNLAAPDASPVLSYAAQNKINAFRIPYLLASDAYLEVPQGEMAQISAFPLGFENTAVRWYRLDGETEYIIEGGNSAVLTVNTFEPGYFRFRAVMTQDDNLLTQADYQVTVTPDSTFPESKLLQPDEIQIIRWDDCELNETRGAVIARYADFSFTAEQNEVMYLYVSNHDGFVNVMGNNGTMTSFHSDRVGYDDDGQDDYFPLVVQKGITYYVTVSPSEVQVENRYGSVSAICLSRNKKLTPISEGDFNCVIKGGDSVIFNGKEAEPEFSVLELDTEQGTVVLSDENTEICYIDNAAIGMARIFLFGKGAFWGHRAVTYALKGVLTEENECEVRNLPVSGTCSMTFTPDSDGSYSFYTEFPEEAIRRETEYGRARDAFWDICVNLSVTDPHGTDLAGSKSMLPSANVSLKKGVTYTVTIINQDFYNQLEELAVKVKKDAVLLDESDFKLDDEEFPVMKDGQPFWPAVVRFNTSLQRDRDYETLYLFDDQPGTLVVLIKGIGDYAGCCMYTMGFYGTVHVGDEVDLTGLEPDNSCTYVLTPEESGYYQIYTDFSTAALEQELASGTYRPEFFRERSLCVNLCDIHYNELQEFEYIAYDFNCLRVYLEAGEMYLINAENYDESTPLSNISLYIGGDRKHIGTASPDCPSMYYFTGEPVVPELNPVYMDDDYNMIELQEGTDYTVAFYANQAPGTMLIVISGIGDYCGNLYYSADILELQTSEMILPDEPFCFDKQNASFRFTVSETSVCKLQADDGLNAAFEAYVIPENDSYKFDIDEDGITLEEGDYILLLSQNSPLTRRLVLSIEPKITPIGIDECAASVDAEYENGLNHKPKLTVRYMDLLLKEGTDYIVDYPSEMIRPGIYSLVIHGIGAYDGVQTVSFMILPDPDKECPMLQEGEQTAHITSPGQIAFYRWIADCEDASELYTIASTELRHKRIEIMNPATGESTYIQDIGETYLQFNPEPGSEYYVLVAFSNPADTGDINFELNSDIVMMYECDVEYDEMVPYQSGYSVPEYRVTHQGNPLQENVDYTVRYIGGKTHYGRAEICLRGIGKYRGQMIFSYYIYPEQIDEYLYNTIMNIKEIECDTEYTVINQLPGFSEVMQFTAPLDGTNTYYPIGPTYDLCFFAYGEDGKLIPDADSSITLDYGETVRFLFMTTWLEGDTQFGEEFSFCVSTHSNSGRYFDEYTGIEYLIQGGQAFYAGFEKTDLVGIYLDDCIYDPDTEECIYIAGFAPDFAGFPINDLTFYTDNSFLYSLFDNNGYGIIDLNQTKFNLRGDITGNGYVDIHDALTLYRILAEAPGMRMARGWCASGTNIADFTGDGIIDLLDVRAILNYVLSSAVG